MAGSLVSRFLVTGVALAALAGPAGALELPFGFSGSAPRAETREAAPPVRMAQVADTTVRISQMEDEMRKLTGKVEELSFLVLQLQEQLRKTQEDNEFRFQDLEKKGSGGAAPAAPQRRSEAEPTPSLPGTADAPSRVASAAPPTMSDAPSRAPASTQGGSDEIGALIGSGSAASKPAAPAPDQMQVASIKGKAPGELYGLGYNYMLSGDYAQAEQTFRQYTQTYPNASDTPDAQYWLGESLYAQSKYREAAEVFLNAQKAHPQTPKAPEMMLKLGMSLVHLDNRETACITYSEINKRYPNMSANVKRKVQAEEKTARCG